MTERILNDRYALESRIGEGGMAVTYRARDLLLNRTVAVKLMREQFTTDQQFVERFRREAQAAARLSHENIAGVYDTGRANGTYYIVMEYIEGIDLKQRLRRDGALPVLTALTLGRQIAAALDAAHRSGLIHRDIKPHNILINQDGKVKVTDFGIAKLASDGEDTGVIIGSVHYISPEQARGEATTAGSDLYSLGAVLFEMLTGKTLFEAENAMAVAHKQIYERPPLPRSLRPEIPATVESMVMRCLEKDPRARYQSAAELQAVITQIINQLSQEETIVITPVAPAMDATMVIPSQPKPAAATPPVSPYKSAQPRYDEPERSGHPWLIALVLIVLAVAVGFGAYSLLLPKSHNPITAPGDPDPGPTVQTVSVPELVGEMADAALAELSRHGLRGRLVPEASDKPKDTVLKQSIMAGETVDRGMEVVLYVSNGPQETEFTVPDVAGQTEDEAKTALEAATEGQVRIEVVEEETADAPAGQVLRTMPAANELVKKGHKVTLIIAKAETQEYVVKPYNGTAPDLGHPSTYVRVEFERPLGSDPQLMWEGTLAPGEKIPEQMVQRKANQKVLVRMLAGKDELSALDTIDETPYPPGQGN